MIAYRKFNLCVHGLRASVFYTHRSILGLDVTHYAHTMTQTRVWLLNAWSKTSAKLELVSEKLGDAVPSCVYEIGRNIYLLRLIEGSKCYVTVTGHLQAKFTGFQQSK